MPAGIDLQETIPNMADINQQATVTTVVNGEQAEDMLKTLQQEAITLRKRINEAFEAGDTKQLKKLEKELKNNQRETRLLKQSMYDVDEVLRNLSSASINQINKALKTLNTELSSGKIKRGSAEWDAHIVKIKKLKAELSKIRGEAAETQSVWTRMSNALNKWGGLVTSAIASITGLSLALNQMRKLAFAQEESAANLKALTGLDDASIQWLTEQASQLSTNMQENGVRIRQSSTEILEAYMLVGSAKPDLLQNKEALNEVTKEALKLAPAAKMDMKDAVDAVTLSMNQYGAAADEASRYTNVMAAGSKYVAANVQSVTTAVIKSGAAASSANVSIEQLVGSIETLAEKGIKDEIAGTGLKKFFLTLQTGADDTNPKVVGLQQALQNLAAKQMDAAEIKKMFGEEGYNVAQVLISEADAVKYYTDAVTNSTVADEQAAINSDTRQAKLDQMKNKMQEVAIQIVNDLDPAVIRLGNTFTNLLKILPPLINFIKNYGVVIVSTGASIAAYVAILKAQKLATDGVSMSTKRMLVIVRSLYRVIKASPKGIAAAAIGAFVGFMIKLAKSTKEVTAAEQERQRIMEQVNSSQDAEINRLAALQKILNDSTKSYEERKAALEEIQKIVPEYQASLTKEGELINNNTDALMRLVEMKKLTAQLDLASTKQLEAQTNLTDFKKENSDMLREYIRAVGEARDKAFGAGRPDQWEDYLSPQYKLGGYEVLLNRQQELISEVKKYSDVIDSITSDMIKLQSNSTSTTTKTTGGGGGGGGENDKPSLADKYKADVEKLKAALQEQLNAEKEAYLAGERSREDYEANIQYLAEESLKKQLELAKQYKQETAGLESEVLDNAISHMEKKAREAEALAKDVESALQASINEDEADSDKSAEALKERPKVLKEYGLWTDADELNASLQLLEEYYASGVLLESEYQQARQELIDAANQQEVEKEKAKRQQIQELAFSSLNNILSAMDSYVNAQADAEVAKTEAKYDQMIEAAGNNTKQVERLEQQKEDEVNRIKAEAADKSFGLQIAMAIASTAQAAINAYSSAAAIPVAGFVLGPVAAAMAIAAGAIQIASIKQQHQAAKANYWTGGFTPDGKWDEPQGTVHSGEFVANRFAVKNPAVRPVLDMIDTAQRNNTISTLTGSDVSAALGTGGTAIMARQADPSSQYLAAAAGALGEATERLSKRLDDGIGAVVNIQGKAGLDEQWKKWEKLNNNKKGS